MNTISIQDYMCLSNMISNYDMVYVFVSNGFIIIVAVAHSQVHDYNIHV